MKPFYANVMGVLDTIEDCLTQERILPCLILLYSTIDVMASLERMSGDETGAAFMRWVERYLPKSPSLRCSSAELYGARCGILHGFTADSKFSRRAKIRMVVYAYGDANADNPEASEVMTHKGCVVVHVRALVNAFRVGLADYLEDVLRDPDREKQLTTVMEMWFTKVPSQSAPKT